MTKSGLPFDIQVAIVCEDIREEKRGKHTLVGVYSGDEIQLAQIPGNIAIACFIEAVVLEPGPFELTMRLSGPGEHQALLKAMLDLPSTEGTAIIATPRIDLLVDTEGVFQIDIGSDERGWTNVVTRKIRLNSGLLANVQQPPSGQSQPAARGINSPPASSRRAHAKKLVRD